MRKHAEEHLVDDEGAEREFWVALFNLPQVDSLRSLRSAQLGRLVAFQVRPADFIDEYLCCDDVVEPKAPVRSQCAAAALACCRRFGTLQQE